MDWDFEFIDILKYYYDLYKKYNDACYALKSYKFKHYIYIDKCKLSFQNAELGQLINFDNIPLQVNGIMNKLSNLIDEKNKAYNDVENLKKVIHNLWEISL